MYKKISDKVRTVNALEMVAEECAELAHACLKAARAYRGENYTPVSFDDALEAVEEELADVLVTTSVLREKLYSKIDEDAYLNPIMQEKASRWLDRIS